MDMAIGGKNGASHMIGRLLPEFSRGLVHGSDLNPVPVTFFENWTWLDNYSQDASRKCIIVVDLPEN